MRTSLLVAAFCALALPAAAQTYKAQLKGADEVPAKQTNGTGTATVTLDGDKVTYDVTYSGLTGPATMAHIHGPAEPGVNAGVLVPLTAVPGSSTEFRGTATMTPQQVADLKAGKEYVNIHTDQNKGGEIRGQLHPG